MPNKEYILQRLAALQFSEKVVLRYSEIHRFYHTLNHVIFILEGLKKNNLLQDDVLFLAALFHDSVYDPRSQNNEENSVQFFIQEAEHSMISEVQRKEIVQIIRDTRHHEAHSEKSALFQRLDLAIFEEPFASLMEYEHQIFREFQFVEYTSYKQQRVEVLQHYNKNGKLNTLIEYVKARTPKIGVFAGSFNPFHKGHYNVLQKAEKCFDKVIIAFGKNPDKNERSWPVPKTLAFRQIDEYIGLLTDYVSTLPYEVTVIRGMRNSTDFQYEQNQYRYLQELKPDIQIINVFCDKEFEHISSSGIRTLEKFNKHQHYLLD